MSTDINPDNQDLTFLAGTKEGVFLCSRTTMRWSFQPLDLQGNSVESIIQCDEYIYAGTRESGVWVSRDEGTTWNQHNSGLRNRHIRKISLHLDGSRRVLIGTEPAAIYTGKIGSEQWHECGEVAEMRERFGWELPYSPEAGCIRDFALGPENVYAAVEVGGILHSPANDCKWELVEGALGDPACPRNPEPFVHSDVHALRVVPDCPGVLFAATGQGLFKSEDNGTSWRQWTEDYCRDVWIDPADSSHLLLGSAERVERDGNVWETRDNGITWGAHSKGLGCPWPQDMVDEFYRVKGTLLIRSAKGHLYISGSGGQEWTPVLHSLPPVQCITFPAEARNQNIQGGQQC